MNREGHQNIVEGISPKRKEANFRSVMLIVQEVQRKI